MWLVYTLLLLSVLSIHKGRALQCFSCVGANDQDCNRQGSQQCPRDSDACAIIRGHSSEYQVVWGSNQIGGVMKSCSFKSFCDRAARDASKTPGISMQCCFSNNCNSGSQGSSSQLSASYIQLIVSIAIGFCLLFVS